MNTLHILQGFYFILILVMGGVPFFATRKVYGKPIKDQDLIPFLDKWLDKYTVDEESKEKPHMLFAPYATFDNSDPNRPKQIAITEDLPFISKLGGIKWPVTYYINNYGTVYAWSKSSARIKAKFEELTKAKWKDKKSIKEL